MFKKTISKEELLEYPINRFRGDIFVIQELQHVKQATDILSKQKILGFDTETRPSFRKGQNNKVSLLQLSTSKQAFLFRLHIVGLPDALRNILSSPSIIKTGAAIKDDITALKKIENFEARAFIDLQNYVKKFEIENFSLQKMCAIVLGFRISKRQQLSNWDKLIYSPAQKFYAATDAWVSLEIYKKLLKEDCEL